MDSHVNLNQHSCHLLGFWLSVFYLFHPAIGPLCTTFMVNWGEAEAGFCLFLFLSVPSDSCHRCQLGWKVCAFLCKDCMHYMFSQNGTEINYLKEICSFGYTLKCNQLFNYWVEDLQGVSLRTLKAPNETSFLLGSCCCSAFRNTTNFKFLSIWKIWQINPAFMPCQNNQENEFPTGKILCLLK